MKRTTSDNLMVQANIKGEKSPKNEQRGRNRMTLLAEGLEQFQPEQDEDPSQ